MDSENNKQGGKMSVVSVGWKGELGEKEGKILNHVFDAMARWEVMTDEEKIAWEKEADRLEKS